jgi:hypothetical protein
MVSVLLNDNREIRFPDFLNKKLKDASAEEISDMEIICQRTGLHWPQLDEDLSVTGILEGRFFVPASWSGCRTALFFFDEGPSRIPPPPVGA